MRIQNAPFGTLSDGSAVTLWRLTNDRGLTAEVLDYGVTIRALLVPDRLGKLTDVVLGYDRLEDYVRCNACFGATIGRFANRIAGACFELNGKVYPLAANNGVNHIHGGVQGFHRRLWHTDADADGVLFSLTSPDGEEGYPGTLQVSVRVSWQGDRLVLRYTAQCDQDTVLNLTNHSYFNLDGEGDVAQQELMIAADAYTPTSPELIPTGQILPVAGRAVDFRQSKPIGKDIGREEACVGFGKGYDTNLVLTGSQPAAVAMSRKSGIVMTMNTDQPGVQLYTPGAMPTMPMKGGVSFGARPAFCLETQHYPDSVHQPQWPSCILRKGEVFESETSFAFCAE